MLFFFCYCTLFLLIHLCLFDGKSSPLGRHNLIIFVHVHQQYHFFFPYNITLMMFWEASFWSFDQLLCHIFIRFSQKAEVRVEREHLMIILLILNINVRCHYIALYCLKDKVIKRNISSCNGIILEGKIQYIFIFSCFSGGCWGCQLYSWQQIDAEHKLFCSTGSLGGSQSVVRKMWCLVFGSTTSGI